MGKNVLDLAVSLSSGQLLSPEELGRVLDFAEGVSALLRRELPKSVEVQGASQKRPPFPWEGCEETISLDVLASGLEEMADYRAAQALQHLDLAERLLAEAREALGRADLLAARASLGRGIELLGTGLSHAWKYLGVRHLLYGRGGLL